MSRKTTPWNRLAHAALCLALAAGLTAQTRRSDLMRQERVDRQTRSAHRIGGPVLGYVFDREAGLRIQKPLALRRVTRRGARDSRDCR